MFALRFVAFACFCSITQSADVNATECDEPSALVQLQAADKKEVTRSKKRGTSTPTFPYVLQAYCGDSWLTLCSDVRDGWQQHNGAFQPDISTTPPSATADSDPDNNYIALGGHDVEGTIPSASTIEGWFSTTNSNNLDFDMEGILDGAFSTVASLTQEIQADYPDAQAQVTCLVSTYPDAEVYADLFQYFGIMIHGDSMTSGSYSIPKDDPKSGGTWPYIKDWIDSDIPNSKIILSVTTAGLEAYMVDWFKELIAEYGLAGMSFWYWNQLDDSIDPSCIESDSVQCDTSDSFACTAVCTGDSPVAGECCDRSDVTTVGNCTQLGQEGCCGGTADTQYCQLVDVDDSDEDTRRVPRGPNRPRDESGAPRCSYGPGRNRGPSHCPPNPPPRDPPHGYRHGYRYGKMEK
eukprot:Skav234502  [mRNA]  locus=scaffold1613:45731:47183:+ [translate_table: standard]